MTIRYNEMELRKLIEFALQRHFAQKLKVTVALPSEEDKAQRVIKAAITVEVPVITGTIPIPE